MEQIIMGSKPNQVIPEKRTYTVETIRQALDGCTDSKLYIVMNLAFACSLRVGEILGLQWCNVHISDEDIAADNAYIFIDKELTRASKRAIEMLGEKDIFHIFTPLMPNTGTRIILKKPKTQLIDKQLEKLKEELGLPKVVFHSLRNLRVHFTAIQTLEMLSLRRNSLRH